MNELFESAYYPKYIEYLEGQAKRIVVTKIV